MPEALSDRQTVPYTAGKKKKKSSKNRVGHFYPVRSEVISVIVKL